MDWEPAGYGWEPRRRDRKRAVVAVARKLATVLHRMWIDGQTFNWAPAPLVEDTMA